MKKLLILFCALVFANSIAFAKAKKQAAMQIPPTVVQVSPVSTKNFQKSFEATGSLQASQGITVTPEISGRVTKIYFKSGQAVKTGEPLVQINDEIIQAQLEKAKAEYRLQKANYQRYLKLYQKHFYERAGLDQVKATLDSAKADVKELEAELKQTLIRAPFSGKLGIRQISLGDYLEPGKAIVSLDADNPIYVNFSLPETYLKNIQEGDKIEIHSHTNPNKTYLGTVDAMNSVIDQETRTLDIRAKILNNNHELIPGSFVNVTIYFEAPQGVAVIPQTAVLYASSGNYVYKVDHKKAVKTMVTLGERLKGDLVIVSKGLKTGDSIVVGGQMKLHNGAPVVIIKN